MRLRIQISAALVLVAVVHALPLASAQEVRPDAAQLVPRAPIYGNRLSRLASAPAPAQSAVPRGYRLYDDMLLPELTIQGASPLTVQTWANGILPIAFAANVSAAQQQTFFDACAWWNRVANIVCQTRVGESDFILVQSANINSSFVGRRGAGAQALNIFNWNVQGIVAHEIGHALGMTHEHMRKDRDKYVQIQLNNVPPQNRHNFDRIDSLDWSYYDFDSIMHYAASAFSSNGQATIVAVDGIARPNMGQRDRLSRRDELAAQKLYGARPEVTQAAPNIVGMSLDVARATLRIDYGLNIAVTSGPTQYYTKQYTICESSVHEPYVVSQVPAAGVRVPFASTLNVVTEERADYRMYPPPKGRICP